MGEGDRPHRGDDRVRARARGEGLRIRTRIWLLLRHRQGSRLREARAARPRGTPGRGARCADARQAQRDRLRALEGLTEGRDAFDGVGLVARDADHPLTYEEAAARLEGPGRSYLERLDEAISTDLNTAQALAVLTRVSRDDEIGRDALGVLGAAFEAVLAFGLLDLEPKDIEPPARKLLLAPDEIDQLLGEREDARRRGDFAVADEIRDMLERLGIEVRDTPEGAVLIAIRPSRKHRPPTSDSAAPPGLDRRASHEDQIVNLGLMATDFPQYRLSFDRPE